MLKKTVIITESLRTAINKYFEMEVVPKCAIGNDIVMNNGDIHFETFRVDNMIGKRVLRRDGRLFTYFVERPVQLAS